MGLRFPAQQYGSCFFVTTTFKDWQELGNLPGFYSALVDSLVFCIKKYNAELFGYVFMPSHLHLLIALEGKNLSALMRDFKKYTAQKVAIDQGLSKGGIWMPRYDRVAVYHEDILRTKLNYIHFNPVKDGLVAKPEDWKWSSASDYILNTSSPLPVWKEWR